MLVYNDQGWSKKHALPARAGGHVKGVTDWHVDSSQVTYLKSRITKV